MDLAKGKERNLLSRPLTRDYIRGVCGILKGEGPATQDLLKERARDREREEATGAKLGAKRKENWAR